MSDILIRSARAGDEIALERLAELDSKPVPAGPMILAEICGEPVAALDLAGGATVADPFRRTADVVELLRVHAAGARGRRRRHGGLQFLPRTA